MTDPRSQLAAVASLLYGEHWRRPLAKALGPHFPGGPREKIDERLVRRWADGDRPVPAWALQALEVLRQERIAELDQFRSIAERRDQILFQDENQ